MATFAEQMLEKLEALMLANPGASSVNIDGQQVSFVDLEKRWQYFKQLVARSSGTRPLATRINLTGF